MNSKKPNRISSATISQISNKMINAWKEERKIEMRPGDTIALLHTIESTIPMLLEANFSDVFHDYIRRIRREERHFCVTAITNMEEPIPGLINKQLALNNCTYMLEVEDRGY